MKRFLITTADERTWRRDRPVLFLGEWCRLYDRRAAWAHLDAEVVPYHWDDREKLHNDYEPIQSVYEELLIRTSRVLNAHHGTNHSARYWRILIGPWLYQLTHILFDRWTMVQRASDKYEIDETLICDLPPSRTIASDFAGFQGLDITWNHYIFGRAIEYQNRIPWRRIPQPTDTPLLPRMRARETLSKAARVAVRDGVSSLLACFTRSDEALIIRSYLPRLEEIKLQAALGQVPKLWSPPPAIEAVPPDMSRRRHFQVASDSADPFVRFAASMIPEQIPTVYLEGYRNLKTAAERLPWPSRPRVIFTSNADLFCTVFQEWAAVKMEAGYPLVIGQHGGGVGVMKRHPVEDHQLRACDRYLSWGWRDDHPRVQPAVSLTNVGKPMATWNPSGNLLLVTVSMQLFAFRCMSQPVGPNQSADFAGEQIRFAEALAEPIRARLTLRIHEALDKTGRTCYVERWKDALPGIDIDPSTTPIERPIRRCRLFVYTYNSTGFVETLGRNIPTIVFWNPSYYELRPSAQPFFDLLAGAGIYYDTPESAAQHVTRIWDDVATWWNQPTVQQARRTFCEQYARMPSNPLGVLKEALLTAPARSSSL